MNGWMDKLNTTSLPLIFTHFKDGEKLVFTSHAFIYAAEVVR